MNIHKSHFGLQFNIIFIKFFSMVPWLVQIPDNWPGASIQRMALSVEF